MGKVGGGAAYKEKEPREEMVRPPKSGPPFTAVAWLASGAPYSGHGGGRGTHMTQPGLCLRVTAQCVCHGVGHSCAEGSLNLWVEKEQLKTLLVKLGDAYILFLICLVCLLSRVLGS